MLKRTQRIVPEEEALKRARVDAGAETETDTGEEEEEEESEEEEDDDVFKFDDAGSVVVASGWLESEPWRGEGSGECAEGSGKEEEEEEGGGGGGCMFTPPMSHYESAPSPELTSGSVVFSETAVFGARVIAPTELERHLARGAQLTTEADLAEAVRLAFRAFPSARPHAIADAILQSGRVALVFVPRGRHDAWDPRVCWIVGALNDICCRIHVLDEYRARLHAMGCPRMLNCVPDAEVDDHARALAGRDGGIVAADCAQKLRRDLYATALDGRFTAFVRLVHCDFARVSNIVADFAQRDAATHTTSPTSDFHLLAAATARKLRGGAAAPP